MSFTVLENENFEKITSDLNEIKESVQRLIEKDLASTYIDSKRVAEILGVSPKTWQTYRDRGQISFIQFNSKIWVKREDLEAFMNRHYIKATAF
jgi:hypothetical protein